MDIQMPEMNGIETTKSIRLSQPSQQHTPIVALTAHALAGEKDHLLQEGMDDYLTKPIDEQQLISVILQWTGVDISSETTKTTSNLNNDDKDRHLSIVNLKEGLYLANNKPDLAQDMLNMLVNSLRKDRQKIEQYNNETQYAELLRVIHKLHGATHYCGVPALREQSEQLETALKLSETDIIPNLVQSLLKSIDDLLNWSENNQINAIDWR